VSSIEDAAEERIRKNTWMISLILSQDTLLLRVLSVWSVKNYIPWA